MKLAIIGFTLALASLAGAMVVDISAAPAHAAPTLAAGCDYLATIDGVKIWQCVDFDGDKFLASTGAFLEYQLAQGE